MSHIGSGAPLHAHLGLTVALRDLAVLTASIGDLLALLEPGVVDLEPLRRAHDEHVRAFADALAATIHTLQGSDTERPDG